MVGGNIRDGVRVDEGYGHYYHRSDAKARNIQSIRKAILMMDNSFIRTDPAGSIKPDKEKSTEKIDGAVATIMALNREIRWGNDTDASIYDDRSILFKISRKSGWHHHFFIL